MVSSSWSARSLVVVLLACTVGCGGFTLASTDHQSGQTQGDGSGAVSGVAGHGGNAPAGGDTSTGAGGAEPVVACEADFTPCGGDLTGVWRTQGDCNVDDSGVAVTCELYSRVVTFDLVWHFNADGTVVIAGVDTALESFVLDDACAMSLYSMSAADACSATNSPTATSSSASRCELVDGSCYCVTTSSSPLIDSGTYPLNGDQLTLDVSQELLRNTYDYCVEGDTLALRYAFLDDPTLSSDQAGPPTWVFTRQ